MRGFQPVAFPTSRSYSPANYAGALFYALSMPPSAMDPEECGSWTIPQMKAPLPLAARLTLCGDV